MPKTAFKRRTLDHLMKSGRDLRLVPASLETLGEIEEVFDDLKTYSQWINGTPQCQGAAQEFLTAKPPMTIATAKHAFLAKAGDITVGLLDIVDGYPCQRTAFIGLLAIRETIQRDGLGRSLYREAERFARNELHAEMLRLAVVETNPVSGFWKKMGFHPTGEIKPFKGDEIVSRSIIMEKAL